MRAHSYLWASRGLSPYPGGFYTSSAQKMGQAENWIVFGLGPSSFILKIRPELCRTCSAGPLGTVGNGAAPHWTSTFASFG